MDFPSGPPPQYQPCLKPLNFGVRMGSGAFGLVWTTAKTNQVSHTCIEPPPKLQSSSISLTLLLIKHCSAIVYGNEYFKSFIKHGQFVFIDSNVLSFKLLVSFLISWVELKSTQGLHKFCIIQSKQSQDACKSCISTYHYHYYLQFSPLLSSASRIPPFSPQPSPKFCCPFWASAIECRCCCWLPVATYRDYNQIKPYMLNPIKHLAGKLNHLHIPQTRYLRIVELANSIRPSTESKGLQQVSVEEISALRSETGSVDARTYHKFCFDLQVHTEAGVFASPSTIFDDLGPQQRKISHLISVYASRLNSRQLLYLNLALRAKINGEFPSWNTLHFSKESPSKVDLEILPTLTAASRLAELKALPKKTVMKEAISAKKTTA